MLPTEQEERGVTVVVGVDGAGRTHRLGQLAAAAQTPVVWVDGRHGVDPAALAGAAPGATLVLVDDAHRLPGELLSQLTAAARRGVAMAISRRPTVAQPELAELDRAVAAQGPVEQLGPLDDESLAALLADATGEPASAAQLAGLREASAGHPVVAVAVAGAPAGAPAPALLGWVQQRFGLLEPATGDLARVLAFGLELTDEALAVAAGVAPDQLAAAVRSLRDGGMLVPDGEGLIRAVGQAILVDLAPAERRRLLDAVARAMTATGGDPVAAATQLSAARARTHGAARVYAAAAERLRLTDPAAALTWYDDAADAGADPAALAAGRAEAAASLGRPVDLDAVADEPARVTLAAGAAAAHQGRAGRAAELLTEAGDPGGVSAVPALIAVGRPEQARAAASSGPAGLRRLAQAALAAGDPDAALPLFIEAAEVLEAHPPALVLPETPHALGALVAVVGGDPASAEHLLQRGLAAGVGGPVGADRHRTLLAWVRMRGGRYDTALAELRRLSGAELPGRERLLSAALTAGLARRSGDIAQLRDAWAGAEPVLARRAVDLFLIEPLEELLVAAARLRQRQHLEPVLTELTRVVDRLGRPTAWAVSLGWVQLQVAVATEDAPAAATAARGLAALTSDSAAPAARQRAQLAAAQRWAGVLAGEVDPAAVLVAADELAAVQLPWEASRLAGHAAIRTADPSAARRLLERARELASQDPLAGDGRPDPSYGGLSEREVEVAQLVLDGRTYREIGAQLYLSPKTVEHHVARIRTKLGATSRAELVAALRRVLGEGTAERPGG